MYVLLKIVFPFLRVLRLADSNKAGMEKLFYSFRMKKISIIKSLSDIDNKELFPVSISLYFKLWGSSDIYTEEEGGIYTNDPESIDSDML